MVKYKIRRAAESESAQIKSLIHLVGINPAGLDWKRFIVAVDDEEKIMACGQIKPHSGDILELASIGTLPEFERQGLASAVVTELLKTSTRPLYLMCMEHNGTFYERFGFRVIAENEMPKYFRRMKKLFKLADVVMRSGEDLLIMKLG
ncbi:MAG: N-acetylglutamate synthase [Chloroflexi bacterium OLB14]|nr:MAG: N-acetylglutamate synthase [Chloroflexi bacterium OLB14]